VGAGGGGYALHGARTDPDALVVAIDASADALAEGAWRAKRARLTNVAFLVEGVERLPAQLAGIADEVTVHFPWGSLLGGLLTAEAAVLAPIASLLKPGAELRVLVSATPRDGYVEVTPATLLAASNGYRDHGLELVEAREATMADTAASRSSWAKRLGPARRAVLARYSRRPSQARL
jgi:16S rRNA (adenine(1408)-N(1))-methyltransferase